ncbi:MAG: hypothetical protein F6K17_24395 [Okeania sp. SIO3C4]|nr:hypothetical protein [Okeania sp. SIO3B3]NER05502.1 hypothetical protein [Okeania sp. SIO3C4]
MNIYKINNDGVLRSQELGGKKEEGRIKRRKRGKFFGVAHYGMILPKIISCSDGSVIKKLYPF